MPDADETLRTQETVSKPDEPAGSLRASIPGLTVLCHADPERAGDRVALAALARGEPVALGRLGPRLESVGAATRRALDDPRLSRRPIFLGPGPGGGVVLDATATKTRLTVDGTAVDTTHELEAADLCRGVVLVLGSRVALLLHLVGPAVVAPPSFGLVGESAALWRLRREIAQVTDLDVPVLLRGESGTGKELVARAIQGAGPRRRKPYYAINMAAVPPALAASELFGAAKGAFSGADKRRPGYFERADGGTLFLDEVGEMPVEVQALMLRALESGEIQPVGSEVPRSVDVRVIAATDADLDQAIAEGRFRAPLLHRLAGFEIELPPLRERRDDIGRLFFHFLREELEAVGESVSPPYPPKGDSVSSARLADPGGGRPFVDADLVGRLASFDWPGNVRQLRNVVRQLVITSRGEERLVIGSRVEKMLAGKAADKTAVTSVVVEEAPADAPESPDPATVPFGGSRGEDTVYRDRSEVGEDELIAALQAHQYRIQPTARALGVSRTALYALIDACPRIRKAADLGREELEAAAASSSGRLADMATELGVSLQGLKMRMRELGLRS